MLSSKAVNVGGPTVPGGSGWAMQSLFTCCVICILSPAVSGREVKTNVSAQEPVIRTTTSLVPVDVLVEGKKTGQPIVELQQRDFLLRDNGRAVAPATFNRG